MRAKLESLSQYMKGVKHALSVHFNRKHDHRGTLWGERFKSVIVEDGQALVNCLAYVDLNPVRAGMVKRPEDYRWSSIGRHVQTGNRDGFLSMDFGLKDSDGLDTAERFRRYRKFLYEKGGKKQEKGGQIDGKVLDKERSRGFQTSRVNRFAYRTRYFTDSGIIGSKAFVSKNYLKFKQIFQSTNEKVPKHIAGLDGVYSLKRLAEG